MAGNGPPPKDPQHRARRNATVAMTILPAEGRTGRAPAWPLDGDIVLETAIHLATREIAAIKDELEWCTTSRDRSAQRRKLGRAEKKLEELKAMKKFVTANERKIWTALWKTPQATQWQKRGWYREVALYARHQAKGEAGSLNDSKEARQREDRLGLNDMAMLRLRWEIRETASSRKSPSPKSKSNASKYGDLKVVS